MTSLFEHLCSTSSDINEHLPVLKELSKECRHVTELGMRAIVSSWAFLEGLDKGGKLVSVDNVHPNEYGGNLESFEKACKDKGVDFEFILGDSTKVEIEETDLLFVDTLHTYEQVRKELQKHASKARKYVVFHDTTSCPEIWPAVEELIATGKFRLKVRYTHNNGLTVLERC